MLNYQRVYPFLQWIASFHTPEAAPEAGRRSSSGRRMSSSMAASQAAWQ